MESPLIKEDVTGTEIQSKFWCYFCSEEQKRHFAFDGRTYLVHAGLLEHISRLFFLQILKDFYPRDAMLARVIAIATCPSVCPSVCHAPVLCQNEES